MPTSASFDQVFVTDPQTIKLGENACVLRAFACSSLDALTVELHDVVRRSPFRRMMTPAGDLMSVAMTNCGGLGWLTDRRGYRYAACDPETGAAWPAMPACFSCLAHAAAQAAGFHDFAPDACLINRYLPGTRLSLHQDKDEQNYGAPIVSVSLGVAATFLFGGHKRRDKPQRVPLQHGDVVVWGGTDRLRFHGVAPLKESTHPAFGPQRINLTFRLAG